ncbi:MAG: tol-pal system-associated acyl-CoA thioesterase [Beijerinckiaceae bacterium]|nr:tol-pal system-associated acyl-CoA thioesterase [Beijerinckiaceae bacterium]
MTAPHIHQLRVYYEDTDFSGFTYHASYLRFLERGRTEFLRDLGIVNSELHRTEGGLAFVVTAMTLDFLKPALMDDWLRVETAVSELRGARMLMTQAIFRGETCLLRAAVTVAAIRAGKPARLPAALRANLSRPA